MKPISFKFRCLRLATSLTFGLGLGNMAWAVPSIQSIDVSPSPLISGHNFTISIAASSDVTQAIATVDFHPGQPRSQQILLTNQGSIWTGAGLVPSDLARELPGKAGALVQVALFDTGKHRAEGVVHVGVEIESISANFSNGVLTVTGDRHDNTLVVSRDAGGMILVNGGVVPVVGGSPTVANTSLIQILGLAGNDTLLVDDANGPMPPASLAGGDGDDKLTGSANADQLDGGPGNDMLFGRGGNDSLIGGPGDDILNGGAGADQFAGGEGADQIIWNPGDGSDVVEGGDGADTLLFNGANIDEAVDLSANGQRFRFFRNVGGITMDCAGIEKVIFHALSGADTVTVNELTGTQVTNVLVDLSALGAGDGKADTVIVNGTATNDQIKVTGSTNEVEVSGLTATVAVVGAEQGLDKLVINALGGDDMIDASEVQTGAIDLTLNGGAGNDLLVGGADNDLLIGGQGADVEFGGGGDDTSLWNPGDGSDVFEGEAGQDTMLFNGANIDEQVDVSANGRRLRFFRNVGNITMDCNEVESVRFNALGGADTITINDLSGTGVSQINLDLASLPDSGVGDNKPDTVIINGTGGNDAVSITGTTAGLSVIGLPATVNVVGSEPALDQLIINMLDGDDALEATGLQDGVIKLIVDGGRDNDVLVGSAGADTLLGGEGDDVLNGGPGLDVLDGGPGNNVLIQ